MNVGDMVRIVLPVPGALTPPYLGKLAIIVERGVNPSLVVGDKWYMVAFDDLVLNMHETYLEPV